MDNICRWNSLSVARLLIPRQKGGWFEPCSDRLRINVLVRGQLRLEATGSQHGTQVVNVGEGAVRLTPPGWESVLRWQVLSPGSIEIAQIALPVTIFARFSAEQPHGWHVQLLGGILPQDPLIASMAQALLRAGHAGAGELYADSAAQLLAAHLLTSAPQQPRPAAACGMESRRLAAVTTYMHKHLAAPVRLDHLARQAELSRFHFIRLFTAATGRTPHQFLTDLRMDRARWWLEHSDESMTSVGRRCGYPNVKHFATVFRRQVGCSPSTYRQQTRASRP